MKMKKGQEYIIKKLGDMYVVRFTYYFETKEECANYVLNENEKLINRYCLMDEASEFKWAMNVETMRPVEVKCIYDADEYAPFVKNLQKTQYNFGYTNKWYNKWVDYVSKLPYDEALELIGLLNEFYVAGKENVW